MSRQTLRDTLRQHPDVSVLIVGGGINGVGLLRELALQHIDALLVDKADFCAGTSAASTRVIHGGLRYLENGEIRLVHEALGERNRLLRHAAHYVRPLPLTIPMFGWGDGFIHATRKFFGLPSKPVSRGALIIKIGLMLYDFLSRDGRSVPKHSFSTRRQALRLRPWLNPDIVCTLSFYDARVSRPEQMCVELVQDAEMLYPQARALNYVRLIGATGDEVTLQDELDGETFTVRPRVVVNATGAWIDLTNHAAGRPTDYIGGTKGSHLVLDCPELTEATRGHMLYFTNSDGRITIFYQFYNRVIAGSTDIPVDDPETALCDDDEVDYILDSIRRVFPSIRVDRSHIVFRFCGVRPLPRSKAITTGQISRDHSAPLIPPGDGLTFPIISLVGGKWTTFRAFAEQVTDEHLLPLLGCQRRASSADLPIGGGRDYPVEPEARAHWLDALERQTGVQRARLDMLLERYGTRAAAVAAHLAAGTDAPLIHHPDYSRREIEYLALHDHVTRLDDVVLRRTLMAMLGEVTYPLLEELAEVVGPVLGWDTARMQDEVERTAALLQRSFGLTAQQLRLPTILNP